MRLLLSVLIMTLLSFGLMVNEASAKRFGGGRTFSMSGSKNFFSRTNNTQKLNRAKTSNRWRGGLTGFFLGGLLASMFFGNGLGSALFSWLLIAVLFFAVVNMFQRRKEQPNDRDWRQP